MGFEPMTLQYRCDPSNQLSHEATDEINHQMKSDPHSCALFPKD